MFPFAYRFRYRLSGQETNPASVADSKNCKTCERVLGILERSGDEVAELGTGSNQSIQVSDKLFYNTTSEKATLCVVDPTLSSLICSDWGVFLSTVSYFLKSGVPALLYSTQYSS
jgi:hypothetical protein